MKQDQVKSYKLQELQMLQMTEILLNLLALHEQPETLEGGVKCTGPDLSSNITAIMMR